MTHNELTKNHQESGGEKDLENESRMMIEQTGDPQYPVTSYEEYLSHLDPKSKVLFPYPLDHITQVRKKKVWKGQQIWYSVEAIGVNKLGEKMKVLSKQIGLSKVYTNHCLRATVITRLSSKGVEARKIRNITGHQNDASITHYCAKPTLQEQAELSSMLHDKGPTTKKLKTSPSCTVSVPPERQQSVDLSFPVPEIPSTSTTTNAIAMPGMQLSSMFAGATFNHATININMAHK